MKSTRLNLSLSFLPDEAWTDAALDDFDKLTYCAEWRPLRAKLCSYSHSEVCTWPSIKLYDNSQVCCILLLLLWLLLWLYIVSYTFHIRLRST